MPSTHHAAALGLFVLSGCARPVPSTASSPASPPSSAASSASASPSGTGAAAWAALTKTLPGTWTRPGKSGPFTVSFKLISNGSALVESWGVGSGHETMTVIHPDHDELVLTHYCAQGNQPRLHAVSATGDSVTFRFFDATNVGPGQAVLVEQTLHVGPDGLEDTEVYKGPDGAPDRTTYRFTRAVSAPTSPAGSTGAVSASWAGFSTGPGIALGGSGG